MTNDNGLNAGSSVTELRKMPELLRLSQILDCIPVHRATIYREIKRGRFPKPIKMGRTSIWRRDSIIQALEASV